MIEISAQGGDWLIAGIATRLYVTGDGPMTITARQGGDVVVMREPAIAFVKPARAGEMIVAIERGQERVERMFEVRDVPIAITKPEINNGQRFVATAEYVAPGDICDVHVHVTAGDRRIDSDINVVWTSSAPELIEVRPHASYPDVMQVVARCEGEAIVRATCRDVTTEIKVVAAIPAIEY